MKVMAGPVRICLHVVGHLHLQAITAQNLTEARDPLAYDLPCVANKGEGGDPAWLSEPDSGADI